MPGPTRPEAEDRATMANPQERPAVGYIAVEGLIGAGKTTLCRRLADRWQGRLVLEEFEDNPFLPRFYEQPERYAFSVELSFLAQRFHQLKRIGEQSLFEAVTVADYSIGKSLVFARVTLPPDEYALFMDLYSIMYAGLPKPDLLAYLHLPLDRVRSRIQQRGRSYEQQIPSDYLLKLQDGYLDHLQKSGGRTTLVVDIGNADLLQDADAYEELVHLLRRPHDPGFRIMRL